VTRPEEALEHAKRAAQERRAAGGYAGARRGGALDSTFVADPPPDEVMGEWAVLAVDEGALYSTRRGGAPVTWLKRLLLRLLRQYLVELEARQTRFNLALLRRLGELEGRVEALERADRG
jgi:hypothetical protein